MADQQNDKAVKEFFGSDADRYDQRHYRSRHRTYISDRQKLVARVLGEMGLPQGARVLDVACGPGHFLASALEAGYRAVGVDSSRDMLRTSAKRLGAESRLAQCDAGALPFKSESFDLVNCSGLIEYIQEPGVMLREFRRVLRPNGRAMVSSTNRHAMALSLMPVTDAIKRSGLLKRVVRTLGLPADNVSLQARQFDFYFHTAAELSDYLSKAGFAKVDIHYCHLQLLPHPCDHLIPAATTACVNLTDRLLTVGPFNRLSEGLLGVGQRLE